MKISMGIVLTFIFTTFISVIAFSQGFEPVDNSDFFTYLFQAIGGVKGASALAIVQLVSQVLMKFGGTPLFNAIKLDPKYKFLFFAIANLALTITTMMVVPPGMTFGAAALSGGVMLLISQYGFRIYELFIEKKA